MKPFNAYAKFYDLLNKEKNYESETEYISTLIKKYRPGANRILEIGIGTGRHAHLLTKRGFTLSGVEKSKEMIKIASQRNKEMTIQCADMADFFFERSFDAVIALFHVMSYQTDTSEFLKTILNIRNHLSDDGIFLFDCWHGPAVLHQLPQVKIRRAQNKTTHITRLTEPVLKSEENMVDVNFEFLVQENGEKTTITEKHPMRYFFRPELEFFFKSHGMTIVKSEEWLTGREPSLETWGVTYITKIA